MPYFYVATAESIAGTESANSAESPAFSQAELLGGTLAFTGGSTTLAMTMTDSVAGHTCQLQFTDNLTAGTWEDIGFSQTGAGNDLTFTAPASPSAAAGFLSLRHPAVTQK